MPQAWLKPPAGDPSGWHYRTCQKTGRSTSLCLMASRIERPSLEAPHGRMPWGSDGTKSPSLPSPWGRECKDETWSHSATVETADCKPLFRVSVQTLWHIKDLWALWTWHLPVTPPHPQDLECSVFPLPLHPSLPLLLWTVFLVPHSFRSLRSASFTSPPQAWQSSLRFHAMLSLSSTPPLLLPVPLTRLSSLYSWAKGSPLKKLPWRREVRWKF